MSGPAAKPRHNLHPAGVVQPVCPAQVLFDGRLLDVNAADALKRKPALDEHSPSHATSTKHAKAPQQLRVKQEEKPLTPPTVNGVSLAPVADSECADIAKRKALNLKVQIPYAKQTNDAIPLNVRVEAQQTDSVKLVAKGKSLHRHNSISSQHLTKLSIYQEINDTDSLCATPPSMALELLRDTVESRGPLGPLTPQPLSPSILTVCTSRELGFEPLNGESGDNWEGFSNLPDMTRCIMTPAGIPTSLPSTA